MMTRRAGATLVLMAALVVTKPVGFAATYPEGSGVIDITRAPYRARGDGKTDNTSAIQQAIYDHIGNFETRTLYFPNGEYLVSDRLEWRDRDGKWQCYLSLEGESRDGTILRLADGAAGFADAKTPRAVVYTASHFHSTSKDPDGIGEGNEAYANYLLDMTIDVGRNPGAIGVDFLGNNYAGIYGLRIRGSGFIGLSFERYGAGPLLVKDLVVEGFAVGIKLDQQDYGVTFEDVTLSDQTQAGLLNHRNVVSMRGLVSRNRVPAVVNASPIGLVTLIDADLAGGAPERAAIENTGPGLFLRNIRSEGYGAILKDGLVSVDESLIDEYVAAAYARSPQPASLDLEVKPTPSPTEEPVEQWANVADFGADPKNKYDIKTTGLQAALDSGHSTILFPNGFYLIERPLRVPATVRRIVSPGCRIGLAWNNDFGNRQNPQPIFDVSANAAEPLEIRRVCKWDPFDSADVPATYPVFVRHRSNRPLVLRDIEYGGYRNGRGCGELYLENVFLADVRFEHPQAAWARQFNVEESGGETKVINSGGRFWALGLKTELSGTIVDTQAGGMTEILGGLVYPVQQIDPDMPAFLGSNSQQFLVYATTAYERARDYRVQIVSVIEGVNTRVTKPTFPTRGYGAFVIRRTGSDEETLLEGPTELEATPGDYD